MLFVLFASVVVGVNLTVFAALVPGNSLEVALIQRPLTAVSAAMALLLMAFARRYFQYGHAGILRVAGATWLVALALALGAAADPVTAAVAGAAGNEWHERPWAWAAIAASLLTSLFLAELAWGCRRHRDPHARRYSLLILPPFIAVHALSQAFAGLAAAQGAGTLVAQTLPFTLVGIAFAYVLLRDGALVHGASPRQGARSAGASRASGAAGPDTSLPPGTTPATAAVPDEMLRRVFDRMPHGLVIVDRAGRIGYSNASASRLFGFTHGSLNGRPVLTLVPSRHAAELGEAISRAQRLAQPMAPTRHECVGLAASGQEIPLQLSFVRLGEEEDAGELLLAMFDITAQRQAEQRLRREANFLRQVIDALPNPLYVRDGSGRFVLANQATADFYGTTTESLTGRRDEDFNENRPEVEAALRSDRLTLETLQELVIDEEYVTDAAGRGHWLRTTRRPLIGRGDCGNMVLGSSVEITAYKQAAIELVRQREALARLSRATMLGELSGSLVHELNQPLAAILANAQAAQKFLSEETPDLGELGEILQDIVADDNRASKVIQGMRSLLKKGEFCRESLDLNDVVHEVLRLMQSELLNAGIRVSLRLSASLPPVVGDRVHLQQVLINLIVNAIEAMRETAASRREIVIASGILEHSRVELRVSDCGPGIPAEQLERVFEPFETTKPNGLGMGLAICRTIIAANRGDLWVAPTNGCGATLCFSLPISVSKRP